jgi:hypothetical protein
MRTPRSILCLVACAASVLAMQRAGAQVAAEPDVRPQTRPGSKTDGSPPRLELETLRPRPPTGPTADPFQARPWAPPVDPAPPQRRAAPIKRGPPPLPFTYLGRIVDGDATVVMLAREGAHYVARLGDTLDRDWRVARIGDDGITLRYLPLNVDQTLSYRDAGGAGSPVAVRPPSGDGGNRPQAPARATADRPAFTGALAAALDGDLVLALDAPERAAIGAEFEVAVGLNGDSAGASASIELAYDPAVLRALDGAPAASTGPGAPSPDPGRAVVDLVAPKFAGARAMPTLVRFRVVASAPTTTSVQATTLSGKHADGRPVAIAAPAPLDLVIVAAQTPR